MTTSPSTRIHIWWLHPGFAFLLCSVPFILAAYGISDSDYISNWNTRRYFNTDHLILSFFYIGAFWAGGMASVWLPPGQSTPLEWGKFSVPELKFILKSFTIGFYLVLVAYIIWTILSVKNGLSLDVVRDTLEGNGTASYEMHDDILTLPGVTTATQFAMAVFMLGTILYFNGYPNRVRRKMIFLFIITVIRSFIGSERLAMIELLVPSILLTFYYQRYKLRYYLTGARSWLVPVLACASLYLIFTVMEYFRTWKGFYESTGMYASVWEFSYMRLLTYYVTALNNGAMFLTVGSFSNIPFVTFAWMWKFPLIGGSLYAFFSGTSGDLEDVYDRIDSTLKSFTNPEFNNNSGLLEYAGDWGRLAPVFYFIFGFIAFALYRRFLRSTPSGILLYPFLFIGIMEISRIAYCTGSRAFPSWLFLFFMVIGLGRIRHSLAQPPASQSESFPIKI